MTTLFKRKPKMVQTTDPNARELIPDITMDIPCPEPVNLPGSRDVNILLVVREHAPRRMDEIKMELLELYGRQQKLEKESLILQRLINALEEPNE